jgi:hypothetical protein
MHSNSVTLNQPISENEPLKIKIRKITRNYLDNAINNPEHGAFLEQYFRSPYFHEDEAAHQAEEPALQPLYSLLVEGQRQSLIKEADPELLVTLVCGMLNEVAKVVIYTQKPLTHADWELTFSVLWDGIRA